MMIDNNKNHSEETIFKLSWISKIIIWAREKLKIKPIFASIIFFGYGPHLIMLLIGFLTGYSKTLFLMLKGVIPYEKSIPGLLAYYWVFFGPALIHYVDSKNIPIFLKKVRTIISKSDYTNLSNLISYFSNHRFKIGLLFSIIAIFLGIILFPYANQNFMVPSLFHPFYIASVILMGLNVFIGSYGVFIVFLMIKLILQLSKFNLKIDLTDPKNRGGLGFIASFAIKITLLFSTGSMMLPFLINLGIWKGGISKHVCLGLVGFNVILILLSFFYPIISISNTIRRKKECLLLKSKKQLLKLHNQIIESTKPINNFTLIG